MSLERIIAAFLPPRAQLVAHVILDLINNNYGLNPVCINTQDYLQDVLQRLYQSHSCVICPAQPTTEDAQCLGRQLK